MRKVEWKIVVISYGVENWKLIEVEKKKMRYVIRSWENISIEFYSVRNRVFR